MRRAGAFQRKNVMQEENEGSRGEARNFCKMRLIEDWAVNWADHGRKRVSPVTQKCKKSDFFVQNNCP